MRAFAVSAAVLCAAGFGLLLTPGADAQTPPYPPAPVMAPVPLPAGPETAEIARCLCLGRDVAALRGDLAARRHSYDDLQRDLARIDSQLARERAALETNNADPAATARFRQSLTERDALFRRSTGPIGTDLAGVTARYNNKVNEFNARCANQPRNPVLLDQVQRTLACPAP